jgi:hypothetical protein
LLALQRVERETRERHGSSVPVALGFHEAQQPMLLVCDDQADPTWQLINVRDIDQVKTWINQHFEKRETPAQFDPDKARR